MSKTNPREQGQALPFLLAILTFVVAFALIVSRVSVQTAQRAQAQTAADAGALAAAQDAPSEGRRSASDIVQRNGASLRSYNDDGEEVVVVAAVAKASARASAKRSARRPLDKALASSTIPVR